MCGSPYSLPSTPPQALEDWLDSGSSLRILAMTPRAFGNYSDVGNDDKDDAHASDDDVGPNDDEDGHDCGENDADKQDNAEPGWCIRMQVALAIRQ